jgi:hypothetical protein
VSLFLSQTGSCVSGKKAGRELEEVVAHLVITSFKFFSRGADTVIKAQFSKSENLKSDEPSWEAYATRRHR